MINRQVLLATRMRLNEWGYWCRDIVTFGLGYPKKSLLAQLQHSQGMIIPSTLKMGIPSNPKAEEVNNAIEKLSTLKPIGASKPRCAHILRIHYTMIDESCAARIRKSGIPRNSYYRYLGEGENWVANYLIVD